MSVSLRTEQCIDVASSKRTMLLLLRSLRLLLLLLLCFLHPADQLQARYLRVCLPLLTGGIFSGVVSSSSGSLASCRVIRGGGGWLASSGWGDSCGLWGSGTRVGSTSRAGMRSKEIEIWSMFFLWIRSYREGRLLSRGRRPTCIQ